MRDFGVFLLLLTLFAVGCEAPADEPKAPATLAPQPMSRIAPPVSGKHYWPKAVLTIPADFPDDGLDPCQAGNTTEDEAWVIGTGTVDRILRDDTKPPRHQRFVVRVCGSTMLFAHNIDLAPRVPIRTGDTLAFRGLWERTDQGGTVHWTHRDKRDKKAGGWIIWKGQNFR